MKQNFEKKKTFDVFMNEIRIKDENLSKPKEMVSFQIDRSRNAKMNENNFKRLHA